FFSSRRRHTRSKRDWSSDVCSSDLIERGLDDLATSMRDIPERHRSIRAVFDYSWRLLPEQERRVLVAVSAFRGGFAPEAAEQIRSEERRVGRGGGGWRGGRRGKRNG